MPLTQADTSKTETFKDGAAWLTLRTVLTKGDQDTVQDLNSNYRIPAAVFGIEADGSDAGVEVRTNAREINRTLFDLLAVEWSLGEGKPTAGDYDTLDGPSGEWVDDCVTQAIRIGRGRAEGNSSRKPRNSRTSSRAARASSSRRSPERSDD
jgi:hypothetical protein